MTREQTVKATLFTILSVLGVSFAYLTYYSYQEYVHPRNVYGSWIEIGTPSYDSDILTLSENGVFRNKRLITTTFQFNGKEINLKTGQGTFTYQIAGTPNSPQLKRVHPDGPVKRFIKHGYEHTVDTGSAGAGKNRRAALSEHFNNKK
ncbi:DUF2850 domain-containing protein [Vibrio sp. 10N.261.55.A7]|uniref:DUF2850 domain-containing protein n=1 Tax=Vibrio sp. 10N.261.55.A7 TaxID=1880851 RepID=UPI000CB5775C|nr:DUF2850 domain-containing protein [Vibrio sp. 10N.261.55.A7]PMK00894.1 hypothetical protein BCU12_19595 [Vibrio sp. 10N.261.55.A7]